MTDVTTHPPPTAADQRRTGSTSTRLPALDGLRGIAALVVVFHHVVLLLPGVAPNPYSPGSAATSDQPWWLTQTPLHLLWAGTEAVYVFFILSGYVLVLPFLSDRVPVRSWVTWITYYPQRIIRLYAPAIAAGLVTVALVVAFPRGPQPHLSWWYRMHDVVVDLGVVVQMVSLLSGPTSLNTPYWSLRWEVLFSLLLPVFVVVAVMARRRPVLAAMLIATALVAGALSPSPLAQVPFYLSMFATGALLASHGQAVQTWAGRRGGRFWAWWSLGALACFEPFWLWPGLAGLRLLSFVAALMVIVAFLGCPAVMRGGSSRWAQWLGRVSFSLYLIHEPIVVSVASRIGAGSPWSDVGLTAVIAVPVSLLAAEAFFRVCEAPIHRCSRAVGSASRRVAMRWLTPQGLIRPGSRRAPAR